MVWQENLFNNLIVVSVLTSLAVIIYCKVTKKTLTDVFIEIKAMFSQPEYE